ncbi:MAG: polysaccharide biosynthesis/export family protein [Limisphaerales bacterium]
MINRLGLLFSSLILAVVLIGCGGGTTPSGTNSAAKDGATTGGGEWVDTLRRDDMVRITFSGIPNPPPDHEERIKGDGTITLELVGPVLAVGLSSGQLQKAIHDKYVPDFFQRLTVTVQNENRVFFVDGEVRRPDRYVYTGEMTVLRAVAAAGGFTDFAARRRVQLTRPGKDPVIVDLEKAKRRPELDIAVYPGDRIFAPRRSITGD